MTEKSQSRRNWIKGAAILATMGIAEEAARHGGIINRWIRSKLEEAELNGVAAYKVYEVEVTPPSGKKYWAFDNTKHGNCIEYMVVDLFAKTGPFTLFEVVKMTEVTVEKADVMQNGKRLEDITQIYGQLIARYSQEQALNSSHYHHMFAALAAAYNQGISSPGSKVAIPFNMVSNPRDDDFRNILIRFPHNFTKFFQK